MTVQTLPKRLPTTIAVSSREVDEWWRHSACSAEDSDIDPELFFPVGYSAKAQVQRAAAKKVCGGCPVRGECLTWALDTGQGAGVWGGLDELERAGKVRPKTLTSGDWCMANQDLIERRRAAGVSWRNLATELGVRPDTVRRAVAAFDAERTRQAVAGQELAA